MLDVVGLALTVLDVGLAASRSDVKLGDLVHRLGLCGPSCERKEDSERSPQRTPEITAPSLKRSRALRWRPVSDFITHQAATAEATQS
ncbi:MAG: hypothetical protein WAM77_11635 [Xanthobacteraceae bacterium]